MGARHTSASAEPPGVLCGEDPGGGAPGHVLLWRLTGSPGARGPAVTLRKPLSVTDTDESGRSWVSCLFKSRCEMFYFLLSEGKWEFINSSVVAPPC